MKLHITNVPAFPRRVEDYFDYCTCKPPMMSARCAYWVAKITHGWRPAVKLNTLGYDVASGWLGVYVWEYLNVIQPMLEQYTEVVEDATATK